MRSYRDRVIGPDSHSKVILTVVTGEYNAWYGNQVFHARSVDSNGDAHDFSNGGPAFGDDVPTPLPASDLKRLNEALAHLPDDGGQLPPVERRLVVQVPQEDYILARVYDRARLPESIAELVRASGVLEPAWVKIFQQTGEWASDKRGTYTQGTFAASPDGRILVSVDVKEDLKVWDGQTHELIKAVPCPTPNVVQEIRFSPDGSLAVLMGEWGAVTVVDTTTWQSVYRIVLPAHGATVPELFSPQFTPDGRYLLLRYREIENRVPANSITVLPLQIYDSKTWARVKTVPEVPLKALGYGASLGSTRSVYLSEGKSLRLWDTHLQRDIASLDENVELLQIAFSPDRSLVAVTTRQMDGVSGARTRLRVWDTANGQLKRELTPYEQWDCFSIKDIVWSTDNRYIFATNLSALFHPSWAVQVWDLSTGRHQAELTARTQTPMSLAMQPDGQLLAYCDEGVFRVWNTKILIAQIESFIKSLSTPA